MNQYKHYRILLILFILNSCIVNFEEIPNTDETLFLNSAATSGEPFVVTLNRLQNVYEFKDLGSVRIETIGEHQYMYDTILGISDAEVKVYENNVFIEQLNEIKKGLYIAPTLIPAEGNHYKIEVLYKGKNISAETIIPHSTTIIKLTTKDGSHNKQHNLEFENNKPNQYYSLVIFNYWSTFDENLNKYLPDVDYENIYTNDTRIIDEVEPNMVRYNPTLCFSNRKLNLGIADFNFESYLFGDSGFIYLNTVSESCYQAWLSAKKQGKMKELEYFNNKTFLPFQGEPIEGYSNVEGAEGVFVGIAPSKPIKLIYDNPLPDIK